MLLVGLGISAWRSAGWAAFLRGLGTGGRLTIGLIVLILLAVAISFRDLFTGFHLLFFEGDTWLFNFSDTLIRLFPMRFWQDGFIMMGLVTILGAVAADMGLSGDIVRKIVCDSVSATAVALTKSQIYFYAPNLVNR